MTKLRTVQSAVPVRIYLGNGHDAAFVILLARRSERMLPS